MQSSTQTKRTRAHNDDRVFFGRDSGRHLLIVQAMLEYKQILVDLDSSSIDEALIALSMPMHCVAAIRSSYLA
jgi:hypothetical protein